MSLVSLAEAQARVGSTVTQEMIDAAEAAAAGVPGMGPLEGERTETYFLSERRNLDTVDGLWLSRRTDSVSLSSDGDPALTLNTDYRLINGLLVQRIGSGAAWGNTIVATYTPTDDEAVVEMIYDLLTVATVSTSTAGLQSVRIGQYSETYATGSAASSAALSTIYGRVLPHLKLGRYASPFRFRKHREDRTYIEAVPS